MNAYLLTAGISQTQLGPGGPGTPGRQPLQTWDSCVSAILYGGDKEHAEKYFHEWYKRPREGENQIETEIKRLVCVEMDEQQLTESGRQPLDWQKVTEMIEQAAATPGGEDFEQGYWVDINQVLPRGNTSSDIESLRRELPADVASGLNWAADKSFLFLVSVLSPPPPPPDPDLEFENVGDAEPEPAELQADLDSAVAALPELRDKEAAALVQARNSVVAAWLWRRFAADTKIANHELHVGPCCAVVRLD